MINGKTFFGNFIFDIDGTLTVVADYDAERIIKEIGEKFDDQYYQKHTIEVLGYAHHIFPGFYALFRWLDELGANLIFFSTGIKQRNVPFAEDFMRRAFGDRVSEVGYKVYSREDCIDTSGFMKEDDISRYQSVYYGQRKKKLGSVVAPESELADSLLIDDDNSYMVKGEEYNFIHLDYCYDYLQRNYNNTLKDFTKFHRAYYLAGMFDKIFQVRQEKNGSLVEAAKYVQYDLENGYLSNSFFFPSIDKIEYYLKGFEILKKYDTDIEYYYPMPNPEEWLAKARGTFYRS